MQGSRIRTNKTPRAKRPKIQSGMGTFTKWRSDELSSHTGMQIHARIATKGQESHIEREGIRNYLSYSEQFDWEVDFGETVPWWICPGTGMRQGGSRRKRVAFQEEEEITAMIDGPLKDKQ